MLPLACAGCGDKRSLRRSLIRFVTFPYQWRGQQLLQKNKGIDGSAEKTSSPASRSISTSTPCPTSASIRSSNPTIYPSEVAASPAFGAMSLANPVLGFIGVTRIRTLIGIHQVVPFGPDHLVVFSARFHLASEHRRHCWGILIGKDCAQHPDLGFHVVVFRERLRIPSSSHEAKPAKARMAIACDDHMVVDSDT
jgi:hypothetical protein